MYMRADCEVAECGAECAIAAVNDHTLSLRSGRKLGWCLATDLEWLAKTDDGVEA